MHELPHHRFTVAEVLRMAAGGAFDAGPLVELLDGALIDVSPQGPRHSRLAVLVHAALRSAFGDGVHLQDHSPIEAGPHSLPEPDLAVVRGDPRAFLDRHPGPADLELVVEISVTSQAIDRLKGTIYAEAGVPRYWRIDVPARALFDHADPVDGVWTRVAVLREGELVTLPGAAPIPVAALLP